MPHRSGAQEDALRALVGKTFARLEVVDVSWPVGKHARAICKCACGKITDLRTQALLDGRQKSCGCHRLENSVRHGKTGTSVYQVWRSMTDRCENPKQVSYRNYGGRGIKVCDHWHRFENFYADMGDCPAGMSIDRIDVNGNYEPENCRWATASEQANNTRRNHMVEFRGRVMTVAQVIAATSPAISNRGLRGRLERGWDIERAVTAPVWNWRKS